jgi:SulP family sulfate permease
VADRLPLILMLALVGLTMVDHLGPAEDSPRSFRHRWPASPGSPAVVIGFGLDVPRVGDLASIKGGLPHFHIPERAAECGDAEDHPALCVHPRGHRPDREPADAEPRRRDDGNKRGGASQECVAQGTANVVTGFFGGMGGCAMIGQSMINVKSGGRTRLSGISAALFLLAFICLALR